MFSPICANIVTTIAQNSSSNTDRSSPPRDVWVPASVWRYQPFLYAASQAGGELACAGGGAGAGTPSYFPLDTPFLLYKQ
tara:strand:- start:97 stop:336 length:240 start_codon:yes stop_codon:yes gene_type:complete